MTAWWKRPFETAALEKLYGSLDANVLIATVERGKPHEVATAAYVLTNIDAPRRGEAMRALGPALTNPYPLVRGYVRV